ncbi:spermidine/putrescine ABC transporter substrate-binding protein [Oxalobacter sp. OttesenSCG-928-P03]|nr:spermidine/putrescine ABC transporter substrate-binding protein [Oxalobacter sp. OttesenSCG-928-P03]
MPNSLFSRFIRPVLSLLGVMFLCLAVQKHALAAGQVVVYNWSEYIPQSVLDNFTKETGIKVIYSTFESNEAMYAKVKMMRGKSYDVIVPSGYFVDMMRRANLLQKVDKTKLTNLKNIDPSVLSQDFDRDNSYSIPYMWGAVGLAYNTKYIPKGSLTKWAQLQDPKYKGRIIMTDDLRDALGLAMRAEGRSSNSTKTEDIKAGYDFLAKLKPSIRVFDVTAIKQALITEEVWLGPIWNGDYLVAKEEKPELDYVFPEEGVIVWVDSFVIPVGAKNVSNAHTFINYMLRPDVAVECVKEYKYSTPNLEAIKLLPADMKNNPILVPGKKEMKNAEFTAGVGDALKTYERYWEQLKTLK